MSDKVTVKISGLNLSRIVTKLINKNILISNLITKTKSIKFSVNESDLKALDEICRQEHKFYVVVSSNGFKNLLNKLPYLIGAILAIIITASYIYSFSGFIFDVEVSYVSSQSFDLKSTYAVLEKYKIKSGIRRSDVDTREIQNLILLECEDVAGCTVKRVGGVLKIVVYPATSKKDINKQDIVSKYDAVITYAEAFVGELKVKVGDIVKAGDILIKSNEGADGKIEGKVYFVSTIIYNENKQELRKTGKVYSISNINFCNIFSIKSKNLCPFSNFLVEKCDFYLTENFLIPIKIEKLNFYEVEVFDKVIPFSEVESSVLDDAYNQAFLTVPNKDSITNVTYSVVSEGFYTRVDCYIETNISLI